MSKEKLTEFEKKVYQAVKEIPKGETSTYKEVAEKVGSPKAWRAVGNALNKNNNSDVPCHRVVKSDGTVGGYNQGRQKKKELLEKESR